MSARDGEQDAASPAGSEAGEPAGRVGSSPEPRGIGWWMLPLFVAVGLAGAVLATALVVVSQNQRIEALRDETAAARSDLADAVDEVESVAEEALAAIRDEVESVRDALATDLPLEDAAEQGVVHLRAEIPSPPAVAPASVVPSAAPQAQEDDDADDADDAGTDDPDPDDPDADDPDGDGRDGRGTGDEADRDARTPPRPPETRLATGFVVAREGEATFLVTTYELLADPTGGDRPVDRPVEVRSDAGGATARVHSWDAGADLLLLRIGGGPFEPLPWRPQDRPLQPGDRITAVGVTPGLAAVRVGGTVASTSDLGLVTDVPALELLAGGPVVDADGRVVAMSSRRATPFGADPVAVPIRSLCGDLLAACPE